MDPLLEPLVRHLLHRVRRWQVGVDRAFDELEALLRGEVSPTTPDQGATRPGPHLVSFWALPRLRRR